MTLPPRALAGALLLAATLAGCGGGDVSWCVSGGAFAAGYNSSDCPRDPDGNHPQPAT